MQHPIIDNLIYAYLKNGWTGLDLTEGKNLFNSSSLIPIELRTPGTFRFGNIFDKVGPYCIWLNNPTYNTTNFIYYTIQNTDESISDSTAILQGEFYSMRTVTITQGQKLRIYDVLDHTQNQAESVFNNFEIMVEYGTTPTEYEPYTPPTTDIANRLKLPLPHYFPHPVIDALISASDGQQTEEENEILRHYLTPLGIGGI